MKKTVEHYFCDICKKETAVKQINYPVVFFTEQTEGRNCKPYIEQTQIDICEECANKALKIHGWGVQGVNNYTIQKNEQERGVGE